MIVGMIEASTPRNPPSHARAASHPQRLSILPPIANKPAHKQQRCLHLRNSRRYTLSVFSAGWRITEHPVAHSDLQGGPVSGLEEAIRRIAACEVANATSLDLSELGLEKLSRELLKTIATLLP